MPARMEGFKSRPPPPILGICILLLVDPACPVDGPYRAYFGTPRLKRLSRQ